MGKGRDGKGCRKFSSTEVAAPTSGAVSALWQAGLRLGFPQCTQPCTPVMVPLNIRSSVTACSACQLVFRPQQALASAPSTSCSWSSKSVRPAHCCEVWHQLRALVQHLDMHQSWCCEQACAQGRLGASPH